MRLVRWFVVVSAVSVLTFTLVSAGSTQSKQTLPIRTAAAVSTKQVMTKAQQAKLRNLRNDILEFRQRTWKCQDALSVGRSRASSSVWALPVSIQYRQWTASLWKQRSRACTTALELRTIPLTNDWVTAVKIVQRIYPGTSGWMLSISDREGGWGRWVWYGGRSWGGYHIGDDFLGADTVGGWMQFRFSTFDPYWRQAQEDLRRRGFVLPVFPDRGGSAKYQAWLDPMGQALTAGFMRFTGKDGCHWCL